MSCSVVGYQCFGGPCCPHLHPEDGGSMDLVSTQITSTSSKMCLFVIGLFDDTLSISLLFGVEVEMLSW
jgi:hypothetical protein